MQNRPSNTTTKTSRLTTWWVNRLLPSHNNPKISRKYNWRLRNSKNVTVASFSIDPLSEPRKTIVWGKIHTGDLQGQKETLGNHFWRIKHPQKNPQKLLNCKFFSYVESHRDWWFPPVGKQRPIGTKNQKPSQCHELLWERQNSRILDLSDHKSKIILKKTIMMNPICNEYGNSYSKGAYIDYLSKNGKIDPVTKKSLNAPIMYNNINLKKAIEAFLEKNPWAYD